MMFIIDTILSYLTIIVPITFVVGIYFSCQLKWIFLTQFGRAIRMMVTSTHSKGRMNSFAAVASVLGGNLGVGNIAGIAVALKTGGPGALFWLWVMAFLGASLKFVSCSLGIIFKQSDKNLSYHGGPMYYLHLGLQSKKIAKFFCVATILSALSVGNLSQVYSFTQSVPELSPLLIGVGMMVLIALILYGGMERFSKVSSILVPLMAILYVIPCVWILVTHIEHIPHALKSIVKEAFVPSAAISGVAGFAVIQAMQVGFNRGLFATDAGAGLEAIIHSSVSSPRKDYAFAFSEGLMSAIAPLVVALLCTCTGLVILVTGVMNSSLQGSSLCIAAFQKATGWTNISYLLSFIIFCFALTTMLTWSFCYERACYYLKPSYSQKLRVVFITMIPIGSVMSCDTVWKLGDIAFNLMLVINLLAIIKLFPTIKQQLHTWIKDGFSS